MNMTKFVIREVRATQIEEEVNLAIHELVLKWELMYYTNPRRDHKRTLRDFSMLEIHVLREIAKREECRLLDIRELLQIPNSTLTSLIKRLEKNNAVVREIDPEDNRRHILKLTQFGKEIDDQHIRMDRGVARNLVSRVKDPQDVEGLVRALREATRDSLVDEEFSVRKSRS